MSNMSSVPVASEGETQTSGDEHNRISQRRRQLKSAKLAFNNESSVIDCVVRDISDHGAGVRCESTAHIPNNVILRVTNGSIYEAEVVWRSETQLGLRFKESQELKRLLTALERRQVELKSAVGEVVDVAEACVRGDYGYLSHPRVHGQLERMAEKARDFIASFDDVLAEFGTHRDDAKALAPPGSRLD